jgi:hypothetical protein
VFKRLSAETTPISDFFPRPAECRVDNDTRWFAPYDDGASARLAAFDAATGAQDWDSDEQNPSIVDAALDLA